MIPTPHIGLTDKSKMAKTVLMPGDPLRAKYIAETYLTDTVLINSVRNMLGYTGVYNGKKVTVFGSGMGLPSVGIYSYEMYNFYDVENIIRVGSAGAYVPELKLRDVVIATDAWSESTFISTQNPSCNNSIVEPSETLSQRLVSSAEQLGIPTKRGRIHSTDVFYPSDPEGFKYIHDNWKCVAVEMDSVALFHNAKMAGKNAATICTISDNFWTHERASSEERTTSFNEMIKIALNSVE